MGSGSSGVTTYPGGRSLTTAEPDVDGALTIDLNRLVNLPCAFTEQASRPPPPLENVLGVAVEAGERLPAVR